MANFNQNYVFDGLGTLAFSAPSTGNYFLEGKSNIPTLNNGGGVSSLLTVVNVNGSPVYTGIAGSQGFRCDFSAVAADAITVVFSSAATPDQGLNVIKTVVAFGQGV